MDRNQAIGITLICAVLAIYMIFSPKPQKNNQNNSVQVQDSTQITNNRAQENAQADATASDSLTLDQTANDSLRDAKAFETFGQLAAGANGEEKLITIENKDLLIKLSSKGGKIVSVELKGYKTHEKEPLILMDETNHTMAWTVQTNKGTQDLQKLFFDEVVQSSKKEVSFLLPLPNGQKVKRSYRLLDEGFTLEHQLDLASLQLSQPNVAIAWKDELKKLEFDMEQSRLRSTVNYYSQDEGFDQLSESPTSGDEAALENSIDWISFKQRFFSTAILSEKGLNQVNVKSEIPAEAAKNTVKTLSLSAEFPADQLKENTFRYYFGPNEYYTCDQVAEGFSRNVYLGWAIVLPITKLIVLPLFDLMEGFISSYGIIIILMVFLIKLALSPLTYKAYVSQAKMKVLQPELAKLKEKHKDDMQGASQAQMKLFSQVGASPLSGCLPMLLQMPFFLALFTFFPNAIQLRGESFLWAHDLSTYDSILTLPFSIPAYGAHVSLFTLLMSASQLVYGHFSMQGNPSMTGTQNGINMKFIQYMMPVMFLFFLNSYPAGLTMYYFVSNLITITQTIAIRKIFVDEDKVRAQLEENKKNSSSSDGKKKSGFQARLADAMKQAQEQQKQNKKKK